MWLTLRSAGVIDPLELAGIRQVLGPMRPPSFKVFGPYHRVQHPIYLAWALMTFGTPLMTGARLSFAVISTAYLMIAIPFEERSLIEVFGDEYRAYQARVRWRMLPGLYLVSGRVNRGINPGARRPDGKARRASILGIIE